MRCVAVIAVRNGVDYVRQCLTHLIDNGIEVAIIDQSSDDGTYEICEEFKNNGLCVLKRMDFPGYFSLQDQLKEKFQLIEKIKTDWLIHQDIDECLDSPIPDLNLQQSIEFEEKKGHTVINFNEFVFLPYNENLSFFQSPYYYFFEPFFPRLMRAWKKSANLSGLESGGHLLKGEINLSPTNYNLRHYIFTSQAHAFNKYGSRNFSKVESKKGWHFNRLNIPRTNLVFPPKEHLNRVLADEPNQLNTSEPWEKHYWE